MYAWFEKPNSIDLRGDRAALLRLGQALKQGKAVTFDLEARPAPPGQEALTSVSFRPLGDPQSPVILQVEDRSLTITGRHESGPPGWRVDQPVDSSLASNSRLGSNSPRRGVLRRALLHRPFAELDDRLDWWVFELRLATDLFAGAPRSRARSPRRRPRSGTRVAHSSRLHSWGQFYHPDTPWAIVVRSSGTASSTGHTGRVGIDSIGLQAPFIRTRPMPPLRSRRCPASRPWTWSPAGASWYWSLMPRIPWIQRWAGLTGTGLR